MPNANDCRTTVELPREGATAEVAALRRELEEARAEVASYRESARGYAQLSVRAGRMLEEWLRWHETTAMAPALAILARRTREFLGLRRGPGAC